VHISPQRLELSVIEDVQLAQLEKLFRNCKVLSAALYQALFVTSKRKNGIFDCGRTAQVPV
jgi:citrate synthase